MASTVQLLPLCFTFQHIKIQEVLSVFTLLSLFSSISSLKSYEKQIFFVYYY